MNERCWALLGGFVLDLLLGDPPWPTHPVIYAGRLIGWLEKRIRSLLQIEWRGEAMDGQEHQKRREVVGGILEAVLVCLAGFGIPWLVLKAAGLWNPLAKGILEAFWCYQLLAARSLRQESMRVYACLREGSTEDARKAVSRIVGRDTQALDREGIIRAAVETVAENASDGVIAPMLYFVLGGVPCMALYKCINTMDSMLGYKNDRYLYYGRFAARLDDAANLLPARLCAVLMACMAFPAGFDGKNAWCILLRDRKKHASPNAGWPEAAMAGALDIRLGGDASYFGQVVQKPVLGDPLRPLETEDIRRANSLMLGTALAGLCVGLFFLL